MGQDSGLAFWQVDRDAIGASGKNTGSMLKSRRRSAGLQPALFRGAAATQP